VDVDPTHGGLAESNHVVTAVGRDYADVPPNRGVWKGTAEEAMAVAVKIQEVERMAADAADVASPVWAGAAAAARSVRPTAVGYRSQAKLLYRHQQEQQQQVQA
jgi:transglutaminase-like putative cysteine protease